MHTGFVLSAALTMLITVDSRASVLFAMGSEATPERTSSVRVSSAQQPAICFTLPNQQYKIDAVTLNLRDYSSASDAPVIAFYTNDNGRPGTLLGAPLLNPASGSNRSANFTFLPAGSLVLGSGGTYWLLASTAFGSFSWNAPGIEALASRQASGVASFEAYKVGLNYGEVFVEDNPIPSFSISGTAVPEPSIGTLALLGLVLWRSKRSRESTASR